jgi:hypothetical protein
MGQLVPPLPTRNGILGKTLTPLWGKAVRSDRHLDRRLPGLQQSHTTFSNFIDSKLFMENMLGADRLPLTLLVDAQGRVLGKYYGAKQWDSPEALEIIAKAFRIKM